MARPLHKPKSRGRPKVHYNFIRANLHTFTKHNAIGTNRNKDSAFRGFLVFYNCTSEKTKFSADQILKFCEYHAYNCGIIKQQLINKSSAITQHLVLADRLSGFDNSLGEYKLRALQATISKLASKNDHKKAPLISSSTISSLAANDFPLYRLAVFWVNTGMRRSSLLGIQRDDVIRIKQTQTQWGHYKATIRKNKSNNLEGHTLKIYERTKIIILKVIL